MRFHYLLFSTLSMLLLACGPPLCAGETHGDAETSGHIFAGVPIDSDFEFGAGIGGGGIISTRQDDQRAIAANQLRAEEHQRILGFLPEFNTTDTPNAVALSPGQKFNLAFKSTFDPSTFALAFFDAGLSSLRDDFPDYGQGMNGFARRLQASYADTFGGTILGGAVFPVLLHQDPRYFRKGTGSFTSRVLYAMSSSFRCKDDTGKWVPNYSNFLGTFAADGIANVYYPASQRGISITMQRGITAITEGSFQTIFDEFWPDIQRRFQRKHKP